MRALLVSVALLLASPAFGATTQSHPLAMPPILLSDSGDPCSPPVVESVGAHSSGSGGNVTLAAPAGIQDLDILDALVHVEPASATITPPAGWTSYQRINQSGFAQEYFWKRASSESGGYAFTIGGGTWRGGQIARISGAIETGSPINVVGADNTGSGTSATALGVTTTLDDTLLVFKAGNFEGSYTYAPPAGFTEHADFGEFTIASAAQPNLGASGEKIATLSSADPWVAILTAFRPPDSCEPEPSLAVSPPSITALVDVNDPEEPAAAEIQCWNDGDPGTNLDCTCAPLSGDDCGSPDAGWFEASGSAPGLEPGDDPAAFPVTFPDSEECDEGAHAGVIRCSSATEHVDVDVALSVYDPAAATQCSNEIDDDGDGKIDFHHTIGVGDDGCWDPSDNLEAAGVPAGTVLSSLNPHPVTGSNCATNTLQAGQTYDGCLWSGTVTLANNVTIRNSHLNVGVFADGTYQKTGIVIEDTTGNGPWSGQDMMHAANNYTIRRVIARLYSKCFAGAGNILIEDSACFDMWNVGGTYASGTECHGEPALISGTGTVVIRRSRLHACMHASEQCVEGGNSAVLAMYAHTGGHWGPCGNKTIQDNRFVNCDASYHIYTCAGDTPPATNLSITGNVFVLPGVHGRVHSWDDGQGHTWSGNVYGADPATVKATGAPMAEP